jgi:CheY-like chemotaxis protein
MLGLIESTGRKFGNAGASASPMSTRTTAPSRRVLIVEDNIDAGRSLAYFLRDVGHQVEHAINGYAAIAIARNLRPDIVFLDLGLPGMDGFTVVQHIKREPGLENVRIVVVTGYGQEEYRERAMKAGCELHLVKPVDPKTLAGLIK